MKTLTGAVLAAVCVAAMGLGGCAQTSVWPEKCPFASKSATWETKLTAATKGEFEVVLLSGKTVEAEKYVGRARLAGYEYVVLETEDEGQALVRADQIAAIKFEEEEKDGHRGMREGPGHGMPHGRGPGAGPGPGFGPAHGPGFGPGFGPGHGHGMGPGHEEGKAKDGPAPEAKPDGKDKAKDKKMDKDDDKD